MPENLTDLLIGKKADMNKKVGPTSVDLWSPYFTNEYRAELNSTYTAVCEAHARHASKVKFFPTYQGKEDKNRLYLKRILGIRPNPIMNAPTFWESVVRNYFFENNAFIFLDWDYTNYKQPLKAIWLIDPDANSMQTAVKGDKALVRFNLKGNKRAVGIEDLCVISRNVKPAQLFGQKNPAINQILKVLQTNYEGIEQAIKTSAFIRFIVQTSTILNDKVKKDRAQSFADTYLGKDSSGVVYLDGATSIQQVMTQPKWSNADELKTFKDDIYEYLGGSPKITMATFTDDDWTAYYESVLEPVLLKIATELTYKIYSKTELERGNEIAFDGDSLHTASLKTRVQVAQTIQKQPVYRPNDVNKLLGLDPIESGDEEFASLNYVKAKDQTAYQTGKDQPPDNEPEEDPENQNQEEEENGEK